jgi:hypothetical protein
MQPVFPGLSVYLPLQTATERWHLLFYNIARRVMTVTLARHLTRAEEKDEFYHRLAACPLPRGFCKVTFNIEGKMGSTYSFEIYRTLLYQLPFSLKGLIPHASLGAIFSLLDIVACFFAHSPTWGEVKNYGRMAE